MWCGVCSVVWCGYSLDISLCHYTFYVRLPIIIIKFFFTWRDPLLCRYQSRRIAKQASVGLTSSARPAPTIVSACHTVPLPTRSIHREGYYLQRLPFLSRDNTLRNLVYTSCGSVPKPLFKDNVKCMIA